MKNLPKDIVFLTDGYFDFDVGLWKSGRRNIRRVLRVPNSYKNILKYRYRLYLLKDLMNGSMNFHAM